MVYTVETLIRTAALIHFSRNFGQYLLSKMRLLFKLRLLFEGGSYQRIYGIHGHLAICQIIFKYGKKHIVAVSIYAKWKGEKKKKRLSSSHNLSVRLDIYREWVIKSSFSPCSVQKVLNLFLKRKQGQFCYLL